MDAIGVPACAVLINLRRCLLGAVGLAIGLGGAGALWAVSPRSEVVVYGGTPAGVAAAVTAARCGADVVLVEPTDHVGGIITNGLTNADIINHKAIAGFFEEFTHRIRDYYSATYGGKSPQLRACRDGYYFEPGVAEKVLLKMLADEPRVRLVQGQRLVRPVMQGSTIAGLTAAPRGQPNPPTTYCGSVFIDASYEGDLAAAAGARCRVGANRGRPTENCTPGKSTPTSVRAIPWKAPQAWAIAVCRPIASGFMSPGWRPTVCRSPSRPPTDRPITICWPAISRPAASKSSATPFNSIPCPMTSGRSIPTTSRRPKRAPANRSIWPKRCGTMPKPTRPSGRRSSPVAAITIRDCCGSGTRPRVPVAVREEMLSFGLCKDEFADNGCWPRQVYVRETRRIVGRYNFTENDGQVGDLNRPRLQPTSIAVAEFPWDCHGVHKFDAAHPGSREGYFYVPHPPIQVPYGVLVPRDVEGLLVPVCCSASHVGFQSLRVEPFYMALGQAAGAAAALAAARQCNLSEVPLENLQFLLVGQHATITYYEDLPTAHPAFAALQFLGARGLNDGYLATPDLKLSQPAAAGRLQRIATVMELNWTPPTPLPEGPLLGGDLVDWLRSVGWNVPAAMARPLLKQQLTLADFAQWIYQAIRSQHPTGGRMAFRPW